LHAYHRACLKECLLVACCSLGIEATLQDDFTTPEQAFNLRLAQFETTRDVLPDSIRQETFGQLSVKDELVVVSGHYASLIGWWVSWVEGIVRPFPSWMKALARGAVSMVIRRWRAFGLDRLAV
jgi:hypothetical protein